MKTYDHIKLSASRDVLTLTRMSHPHEVLNQELCMKVYGECTTQFLTMDKTLPIHTSLSQSRYMEIVAQKREACTIMFEAMKTGEYIQFVAALEQFYENDC